MRHVRVRIVSIVALSLVTGALSFGSDGDVRVIHEGALDEIHLKVASIPTEATVSIRAFSVEGCDLGTGGSDAKKETRSDAARALLKIGPDLLAEAFRAGLTESGKLRPIAADPGEGLPEDALVVEGRFLKIDPGSRAKRYFAGFGAGKSGIQVTGVVKDRSGAVLAEFTHMRNSGIGVAGGDYTKFLSDDTRDVGRDIARFLVLWATGQDLQKK